MRGIIIKNKKITKKTFIFLFWVCIWQLVHMVIGRDMYVPSPFSVLITLRELVVQPIFWKTIIFSIYRVLVGLSWSILFGVLIGTICALNSYLYDLINPLIIIIKSTPVLSFIIIALIWLSSSNVPIFICFLMCFPIIWTNVVAGIRNVDIKLLQMAKIYGVNRLNIVRKIYLPSVMPYLTAGCLTSLGLGWKVSVAAEVLSHPKNAIGSQLYGAKVYLDSSGVFAWTLIVIILSIIFESLFNRFIGKGNSNRVY